MEIQNFVIDVLRAEGLADDWHYKEPGYGSLGDTVVLQNKTKYLEARFPMRRREVDEAVNNLALRNTLKQRIVDAIANAKQVL
jgi:hypothetical protein